MLKNAVTDYGAVADADWTTATLTVNGTGLKNVASTTAIFGTAAPGMMVRIGGANGSETHIDTIATVTDSQHIVLTAGAVTGYTAQSHQIAWGTNNTAAVDTFNAEFAASSADLVFPAIGTRKYLFGNTGADNGATPGKRLRRCTVYGYGVTLIGALEFGAGAFGFPTALDGSNNPLYALTQRVNAGATQAVLTDASKTSLFTSGKGLLGSCGTQGPTSNPPNLFFFDYVTLSAASAGIVSFADSVSETHLTTYPQLDPGNKFLPNLGGPSTLYKLPDFFDITSAYCGFALVPDEGRGVNATGWDLWFKDVSGPGASMNITATRRVRLTACLFPNSGWEVDKLIGILILDGGTRFQHLLIHSSAPALLVVDNARFVMLGTPRRSILRNWNSDGGVLQLGVDTHGRCESITCKDSIVASIDSGHSIIGPDDQGNYGLDDGVFSYAKALALNEPLHWAVPGTNLITGGQFDYEGNFAVTDFTADSNNYYAATTLSGDTWPSIPPSGSGVGARTHPAPILNFDNVTGCPAAVDLSNSKAQGKPWGSYSNRTYDGSSQSNAGPENWGAPTRIVITVSQVYSGAGSLVLHALGSGRAGGFEGATQTNWNPQINCKALGTRTWTRAAGWTGVQTGDTLADVPAALILGGHQAPAFTADVSGQGAGVRPIITIEIESDQALRAPAQRSFQLNLS